MQAYLSDLLHVVAQALLAPDIILLLLFIAYALFCIGSLIAEALTERRYFNVVMPAFLKELMDAPEQDVEGVIKKSGLLKRQKEALLTVYEYRDLPGDALLALVKRTVSEEESRYDRIVGRDNTAARVAPMLGLMGTLIPLGPGIQALGNADTAALSSSLLVAFDTTVAGLVVAAVCLVVGKIRSIWYEDYLSALDAAMATRLEKIEGSRQAAPVAAREPRFEASRPSQRSRVGVDASPLKPDVPASDLETDPRSSFVPEPSPEPAPARVIPSFEPARDPLLDAIDES